MRLLSLLVVVLLLCLFDSALSFTTVQWSTIQQQQQRMNDRMRLRESTEQSKLDQTDATISAEGDKSPKIKVVCPDCDQCDGSGRIAGGIGAVIPWIPIKAYRPCPNFIDRGGIYERSGQGLDEIAFGRDSTFKQ